MKAKLSNQVKKMLHSIGLDIIKYRSPEQVCFPPDFDLQTQEIIQKVRAFTQTSPERLFALCEATRYIVKHQIPGEIVECGVWKGGSMMAVAHTLLALNHTRHLYLFDTFEGMTNPSEADVAITGSTATELLQQSRKEDSNSVWCYASLTEVETAFAAIEYDPSKIHFIKGRVEETIPTNAPEKIALLRLDTDWYESTRHELIHLFPRLSPGGVIIIDDYGHWQGARKAVDEYFDEHQIKILLNRIDYTGRIGVVV